MLCYTQDDANAEGEQAFSSLNLDFFLYKMIFPFQSNLNLSFFNGKVWKCVRDTMKFLLNVSCKLEQTVEFDFVFFSSSFRKTHESWASTQLLLYDKSTENALEALMLAFMLFAATERKQKIFLVKKYIYIFVKDCF